MKNLVVHTLSDLLKENKKIYQVNYLVADKLRLIYIIDEPNVLDMKLTKSGFIDLIISNAVALGQPLLLKMSRVKCRKI